VSNEGLDLFPRGIAQCLRASEIDSVGLDQIGIELVLTNYLTEMIADRATGVTIPVCRLGHSFRFAKRLGLAIRRADLLD
jgi:hypothetical protein